MRRLTPRSWCLLAVLALAGCYKPSILEGGFKCDVGDKPCPDGFTCSDLDQMCYMRPPISIDAGVCATPVASLCSPDAGVGNDSCNPVCQTGCTCARCNVGADSTAACGGLVGTKTLGAICTLGAGDDCAPGFICLKQKCGTSLGRCYRHCATDDQCNGGFCQASIPDKDGNPTSHMVCNLAPSDCDGLKGTGCPSAALNCYVTGNKTLCDCPSAAPKPGQLNDPCVFYNDCAAGYMCIANVAGLMTPHCQPVCDIISGMCITGRHCVANGPKYGYCDTN
jgi:hypothetical protein